MLKTLLSTIVFILVSCIIIIFVSFVFKMSWRRGGGVWGGGGGNDNLQIIKFHYRFENLKSLWVRIVFAYCKMYYNNRHFRISHLLFRFVYFFLVFIMVFVLEKRKYAEKKNREKTKT